MDVLSSGACFLMRKDFFFLGQTGNAQQKSRVRVAGGATGPVSSRDGTAQCCSRRGFGLGKKDRPDQRTISGRQGTRGGRGGEAWTLGAPGAVEPAPSPQRQPPDLNANAQWGGVVPVTQRNVGRFGEKKRVWLESAFPGHMLLACARRVSCPRDAAIFSPPFLSIGSTGQAGGEAPPPRPGLPRFLGGHGGLSHPRPLIIVYLARRGWNWSRVWEHRMT